MEGSRTGRVLLFDNLVKLETMTYKIPNDIDVNFKDWNDYDNDANDESGGNGNGN
jgi:hypothetical protein